MTTPVNDYLYRAEHELRTLREQLKACDEALILYARCGDDDPDTYDRMYQEYERLFAQVEAAEERVLALDEVHYANLAERATA